MQNKSRLEDQRTEYTLANQQFEREVQETNRKRRPLQVSSSSRGSWGGGNSIFLLS